LNSASLVEVQLVMTWFINGGTQDIAMLEGLQRESSHLATIAAGECTWQHRVRASSALSSGILLSPDSA
jgi:hypothetical protein